MAMGAHCICKAYYTNIWLQEDGADLTIVYHRISQTKAQYDVITQKKYVLSLLVFANVDQL